MEDASPQQASIIGRDTEVEKLRSIFDTAMAGEGQTVLLSGPAGIGKSRLVEELEKWAAEAGATFTSGTCSQTDKSEPYRPFRPALKTLGAEEILSPDEQTCFDELFLISRIGLLITHQSSKEDEGVDEDILSSMLTAVQDFVKDSFGEGEMATEGTGLGRLEYRNKKVMIEHGQFVFLAGVVSGQEHHRMRNDLKRLLRDIETDFAEQLADWDGDLDKVAGTMEHLQKLIDSRYPVRRTVESMNIEAARLEVQEGIMSALASNSGAGLVLALEDIHKADETSLLAIPYLARNIAHSKILVCATYEPDDSNSNLNRALNTMFMESTADTLELKGLARGHVRKLIASELGGGDVPDELVRHLMNEGGGNPFFTLELLRTMRTGNVLTFRDDIWIFRGQLAEKLPTSVGDIVSRQLEELDIDSLQVLEFASVLGMEIEPQIISIGAEMDAFKVEKVLRRLADADLLVMSDGGYRFKHGTVQDAVYSGLSQRWQKVLHRSAGNSLEFAYEYDIDTVLFRLAYHFARTNDFEKGIEYSIEAGEKAAGNHSPKEAASFLEDANRLIGEFDTQHPRGLDINIMLAELYELNGQYDEAIDASEAAKEACRDCGTTAAIEKRLGFIYFSKGDYDLSIEHFSSAAESAKEAGDELLLASIYGGIGKVYLRKGEYERSQELQENYLAVAEHMGIQKEIGQAYMNLGGVYWHKSDYETAREMWENCLEHMRLAEDDKGIAYALNNLGAVNEKLGEFDDALQNYVQCILMKTKIGDIRGMAMTHNNLGIIYHNMADVDDAIENYKKSLEIRHRIGDLRGMSDAYNNLGAINFDSGNYGEAIKYYNKYIKIVEKIDDTWGIAQAYNNLSEAELAAGDAKLAMKHCETAASIAEKHGFQDVLSSTFRIKGQIMAGRSRWEDAFPLFEKSLAILEEIGELEKLGKAHLAIGTAYFEKGDLGPAKKHVREAMKLFEETNMKAYVNDATDIYNKIRNG